MAFINGVLGSFVRGEVEPEAKRKKHPLKRRPMNLEQTPENGAEADMARTSFTVTELNATSSSCWMRMRCSVMSA